MAHQSIGKYRKVYPRIWRDPGFCALTKDGRELALYLITGPQTNRIGLFHFSVATASEDLGVTEKTIRKALADISTTFGWRFESQARVFYIPSWWRWNPPENENVLKGNLKDITEIRPCVLVEEFVLNTATLPESLRETFAQHCAGRLPARSPIQNQDQKQRTKQKQIPEPQQRLTLVSRNLDASPELRRAIKAVLDVTGRNSKIDHLLDAFGSGYPELFKTSPRSDLVQLFEVFKAENLGWMG